MPAAVSLLLHTVYEVLAFVLASIDVCHFSSRAALCMLFRSACLEQLGEKLANGLERVHHLKQDLQTLQQDLSRHADSLARQHQEQQSLLKSLASERDPVTNVRFCPLLLAAPRFQS